MIGVESGSRIGLLPLFFVTIGMLVLGMGAYFIPGDDADIGMKIVMETVGENYCTEDPTACVGEQIAFVASKDESGPEPVGHVGTTVPDGYVKADDFKGVNVQASKVLCV